MPSLRKMHSGAPRESLISRGKIHMPSLNDAGSNTASNDAAAEWARQIRQQKRKCEEENGVLRNIIKRAKTDGQNTKSLLAAIKTTKLDPAVVAADLRDQLRYMAIIRVPMTQAELFGSWDSTVTEKTAREDDLWDADDKGYHAGRHGVPIEDGPYPAGTERHVHWLKAWHKGQAAIAREMGPDVTQASTTRERPARKAQQPKLELSDDTVKVAKTPRVPRAKRNGAAPSSSALN
jgi:ribosome modulation factor